jgi:hypothetical protein
VIAWIIDVGRMPNINHVTGTVAASPTSFEIRCVDAIE